MPVNMDVTKMKVADLKRELKLRGLPVTGNKTELAERLQEAAADFTFEDSAISGEDLLEDEDAVLTDEEKILDENELLKSPTHRGAADNDKISADKELLTQTDSSKVTAPKKIILKRKISMNLSSSANSDTDNATATKLKKNNITANDDKLTVNNSANAAIDNAAPAAVIKQVSQLTAQQRLELRAKKFGINNATTAAVDKTELGSKPAITAVSSQKEAELLKKRAERFGCVVSSKMAQLDVAERLQKRAERFGGATNTTKTTVPATAGSDVWAEKARLRLERFNSKQTTATKQTIAPQTLNATN